MVKGRMTALSRNIEESIGKIDPSFILEEDAAGVETMPSLDKIEDESDLPPLNVDDEDTLDLLINAEIFLPPVDGIALEIVK
jgi:hypothetical protein